MTEKAPKITRPPYLQIRFLLLDAVTRHPGITAAAAREEIDVIRGRHGFPKPVNNPWQAMQDAMLDVDVLAKRDGVELDFRAARQRLRPDDKLYPGRCRFRRELVAEYGDNTPPRQGPSDRQIRTAIDVLAFYRMEDAINTLGLRITKNAHEK